MIEGPSQETDLLLQGRMPTQAQEIDGHVLINDLGSLTAEGLSPGDLLEVEVTDALPGGLVARALAVESPAPARRGIA